MRQTQLIPGVAVVLLAAALATGCSGGHSAEAGSGPSDSSVTATPTPGSTAAKMIGSSSTPSTAASNGYPTTPAAPGAAVPQVRDAFAVLQATYNDSCGTPGNCQYFLNRLLTNLDDLGNSMKASPKGTAHFRQPLAWIGQMQTALDGDFTFDNLHKHQSLLVTTRDKINTWMQSYPDDYR
ncbi:hypothetical protein SO3561_03263 [Streptomyces olivochromogenes]|uniref:Lipoprotein n=1 Tax=Streptomyces olivochromogenes TaxID=1963 RepID=A0A250VCI8_STROL|nr:hypothetical protein SO3561_03263 [Streptomyces olivochromogenes]